MSFCIPFHFNKIFPFLWLFYPSYFLIQENLHWTNRLHKKNWSPTSEMLPGSEVLNRYASKGGNRVSLAKALPVVFWNLLDHVIFLSPILQKVMCFWPFEHWQVVYIAKRFIGAKAIVALWLGIKTQHKKKKIKDMRRYGCAVKSSFLN